MHKLKRLKEPHLLCMDGLQADVFPFSPSACITEPIIMNWGKLIALLCLYKMEMHSHSRLGPSVAKLTG